VRYQGSSRAFGTLRQAPKSRCCVQGMMTHNLLPCSVNLCLILSRSQRLSRHNLDTNSAATLHNNLLNLGIANQMQIGVMSTSTVDISVSRVRATSSIAINPFLPVTGSMTSLQVLEIVGYGDTLGLDSAEEVLHHGVCVVAKTDCCDKISVGS